MGEAGYTKGADGFFASPGQGKLTLTLSAPQTRPELPVLAANWRQVGFDMQEQGLASTLAVDPEVRGSFPSLSVATSGAYENQQMVLYRASEISSPETRWRGENASGWREPAFDRLVDAFNVTMDPNERVRQRAQMAELLTQELPSIPLSYNPNAHAFLSTVTGITKTSLYTTGRVSWNVERWGTR
jgi:peptide/nickel transport system substrate-binding protein